MTGQYDGWMDGPFVLTVSFEDLVIVDVETMAELQSHTNSSDNELLAELLGQSW